MSLSILADSILPFLTSYVHYGGPLPLALIKHTKRFYYWDYIDFSVAYPHSIPNMTSEGMLNVTIFMKRMQTFHFL